MLSHKQIPIFSYESKDFNFVVKLYEEKESLFDNILQQTWKQAEKAKAFRYTLNIRSNKSLKGRYRFLVQLNPERAECRRVPESITSMLQSFDSTRFNFTNLTQQEILFDIGDGDTNDIVAINASPLEEGHCLVLLERLKCLPQVMTEYSLRKVVELCLLSSSWSLRATFNSLCAHASVNHLHWHLYYLKYEMLLEYIDIYNYTSNVYLLINYPAKGFCLKLSSFKSMQDFVSQTFLIVNYLQLHQVAHNVYITRAKSRSNDDSYNDLRIYIWVRKHSTGVRDTTAFLPAVCEFFGHFSIRDEEVYNNLTEDKVKNVINDTTEEYFLLIKDELKIFLEK
ncbi:GDP-D-glucose phosphorylase 1 [Nylanderia fulva]|uniref:GDP-D-glucose phosphorylase 1 n=1 Tax=Nylanderia fulva TaxID=613905 RepID=UPI0010FAF6F4|nr:GDP-D-glucose phosphorylase 1 [Nylanderia fulva]